MQSHVLLIWQSVQDIFILLSNLGTYAIEFYTLKIIEIKIYQTKLMTYYVRPNYKQETVKIR